MMTDTLDDIGCLFYTFGVPDFMFEIVLHPAIVYCDFWFNLKH